MTAQVLERKGTTGAQGDRERCSRLKLGRKIRQTVFPTGLKLENFLAMHHAVFTAANALASKTHEKAQGKRLDFRHTSQKCHGNTGSSPKAIKVNGKIPTERRELWIPGFPWETVQASFLASFEAKT